MKELNQTEDQLLSWKPRPPSPSLKKRIFPQAKGLPVLAPLAFGRWLAPAMTIFILGIAYLGTNPQYLTQLEPGSAEDLPANSQVSQPNLATRYASASPSDRNVWAVMTFDSTNAGQSVPTINPVSIRHGLD